MKLLTLEMEAAVSSLPDEMLEIIFSYCTHSDLVRSIQNVCCRWRAVAQSSRVWKYVTYCPDHNTRSEQVVEMLEMSANLRNIILKHKYDDSVLQAISDNCAELRELEITRMSVEMNFIKNFQGKCPNIEYLNIQHPVLTDLGKCEEVGKFTNLKVLLLNGREAMIFSLILKPVADYCRKLEHLELGNYTFKLKDLQYLLTMRKDTLHTLGVPCFDESGQCVLPALTTCKLESLTLLGYCYCVKHYEKIEYFGRLKTVKSLSIGEFYSQEDDFFDVKQIFENGNLAQLEELRLEEFDLEDSFTEILERNCPLLKRFSFGKC